jgi:hypothetical protein
MVRHVFQACSVWIYTQSNITSIIFTWVHYTNTEKTHHLVYLTLIYNHSHNHHPRDCHNLIDMQEQNIIARLNFLWDVFFINLCSTKISCSYTLGNFLKILVQLSYRSHLQKPCGGLGRGLLCSDQMLEQVISLASEWQNVTKQRFC